MKTATLFGALLLAQTALAAESMAVLRPEVTVTPIPAAAHAIKQPWLDRALLRAKANADRLRAERGDRPQLASHSVELKWPVRPAINVTETQIEYLSMHVDQDDTSPGILDWNCGDRTYNGHNGVDIGIGPYAWYRMRRDQGIAIAAAPGVIVEKTDNFPEESCDTNQKDGNLIVIEHEDASLGIYAHIRTGSATRKEVDDWVYEGEYLGVIGSSGISNGPHLHFGVGFFEQNGSELEFVHQDPWDGACNNIGGAPWWEEQPSALLPSIMDVATHSAQPTTPACPQSEEPNFKDSFMPGDPITFSVVLHDVPAGEIADIIVRQPNGTVFVETTLDAAAEDRLRANLVTFATNLPGGAMAGEWKLEVTFMGNIEIHHFWVNGSPPATPTPTLANNAYNGLWYDAGKSGEGYNIITAPNGTIIFFYGSDEDGNRLWLLSELVTGNFTLNQARRIVMYESTGGNWEHPIASSRGLSPWGDLELTFSDCGTGTASLDGVDGFKLSNITKLAAVPGSNCASGTRTDNIRSGLWYDPALTGEGFNSIVAPNGVVIFYYGFDANGERLWMHSNVMAPVQSIGAEVNGTMNRSAQGTFNAPVTGALQDWGTINVKVNSCESITITMDTNEGLKVSQTVRLAQVVGLGCS